MKYALVIMALLLLVTVSGCSTPLGSGENVVYIFLVDKSGSTTELAERNQKDYIEQKISEMPAGSTGVAIPITANPLAGDRNNVVRVALPDKNWYSLHDDMKVDRARKQFAEEVEQMLQDTPVAQGTAILDTLRFAESAIPKDGNARVHMQIISDMMEVTDRQNFYQSCSGLDTQSEEIIRIETESNRLPNLKNVEIKVVGAGIGNKPLVVACRDQVKAFWFRLFESTGATVIEYDPSLLS